MMTLFRNGGWSMYWVVGFGFVALGAAAYFAARPSARHEGFLQWMSRALLWSVLTGICSDVATAFYFTSSDDVAPGDARARLVLEGLAESLSPGIVGFAFLGVVALLAAVGRRRLDASRS
jgi:hypothetical protein